MLRRTTDGTANLPEVVLETVNIMQVLVLAV
jgi:hypothetical protein